MLEKEITFDRFVRGLLILLGVAAAIVAISYLSSVLVPFFVAWFLAYLLFPVVKFFQNKLHLRFRILAIIATLVLLTGIIYGLVAISLPSINHEVDQFREAVERFVKNGASENKSIPQQVQRFIERNAKTIQPDQYLNQENIINAVKEIAPRIWDVIYRTAAIVLTVIGSFIGLLYFFFILVDYEKLYNGILHAFPDKQRGFVTTLMEDLSDGMNNYFRGQALISLCVGILFCIGFLIIGFPLAIPLGIAIGLMSLIPYLHALGLVPILILSFMKAADTGQNFWIILTSALAVFLVVQVIEDMVLTPRIMGKAMSLPPFLILLALSVWGYMLGIIGMIIALPVTTLIISYYKRYVVKEVREETPDKKKA